MIHLDAATVLLQWATGGIFFGWVTTRLREVGLGYGWLLRIICVVFAAGALVCGVVFGVVWGRELAAGAVVATAVWALAVSVVRLSLIHISEPTRPY